MDKFGSFNKRTANSRSGNILYKFFHQIKKDMGLDSEEKFLGLIKNHYRNKSKFTQIGYVNNLKFALISRNYSFKTFLRGLSVLDVIKIKITLEITKKRGEVSIHTYSADLDGIDSDEEN
jgi:hypothetical protein